MLRSIFQFRLFLFCLPLFLAMPFIAACAGCDELSECTPETTIDESVLITDSEALAADSGEATVMTFDDLEDIRCITGTLSIMAIDDASFELPNLREVNLLNIGRPSIDGGACVHIAVTIAVSISISVPIAISIPITITITITIAITTTITTTITRAIIRTSGEQGHSKHHG